MWGGLTEDKVVVRVEDEDTGEILHLAFTDVFTREQADVYNRITAQVHQSGETDLRRRLSREADGFNEEAKRRGWTVRMELWERPPQ